MMFSGGNIVATLDGAYNLNSLANSVATCVEMLLGSQTYSSIFHMEIDQGEVGQQLLSLGVKVSYVIILLLLLIIVLYDWDVFMSPQTETKASVGFKAGVKDYKLTYYTPEYETKDTDILAAFRVTPQPGVQLEEAGAAVAAEFMNKKFRF
ncbi:hypothetical protein QVD17_31075 [Tagetes erecta]|uniref:Ribulose bisphosphate carboxylase large chain n=1 Tax=Tagetes erecta TaxID=13708 RepID=A0AAD8K310_TARER|nr:hypothetical protein QVD17_31075 [Tagetes erecta]